MGRTSLPVNCFGLVAKAGRVLTCKITCKNSVLSVFSGTKAVPNAI